MPELVTHKASDLKPQTRAALEAEFGRFLRDNDEVSITTKTPSEEERQAALLRLEAHYALMDERTKDIPDEEIEEIMLEAIRSVRPGYEERR
jgi:hypothetical protein